MCNRYEINLIKFKLTQDSKYEIILNAIGKIIETFMNINFRSIINNFYKYYTIINGVYI